MVDFDALFGQFGIQHLGDQRNTATAAGTGLGFRLDGGDGVAAHADRLDDIAFADVEAGADLRGFRQ